MAQNSQAHDNQVIWASGALRSAEREAKRWPAPYPAMLVTVSSVLLWAAIIGGARWLLG